MSYPSLLRQETLDTLYNSLLITRILSKYIVQTVPLSSSHSHYETPECLAMSSNSPLPEISSEESPPTLSLKHGE